MIQKGDKLGLVFDENFFTIGHHRRKNVRFTLLPFMIVFLLFFCFTGIGFWYLNYRANIQPLNIFVINSQNESFLTKVSPNFRITTEINEIFEDKTTHEPSITGHPVCTKVPNLQKFDCYPTGDVTEDQCVALNCCYQKVSNDIDNFNTSVFPPLGTPYCYYPVDYVGYKILHISKSENKIEANLERVIPSGFPDNVLKLDLVISELDAKSLRIKITDPDHSRHEAPLNNPILPQQNNDNQLYAISLYMNGTLIVERKSNGVKIFQTNLNQLIYADQFLQLSTELSTKYIYGLGEWYEPLLKNFNWTRTILFNRDNFPHPNTALYGSHAFYLAVENDGTSNGVFLLNSNSMDVVLQPTPALTYRTIGGILDIFIFLGPSPSEVIQQYTNIISRPFMPPYWSLGFHLCRYNYNSLNKTREVWQRTRDAQIPFDVQWNDIDYMRSHSDFTYDTVNYEGLPAFVKELHDVGMRYVVIVDPGISNSERPGTYPPYDDGVEMDVFVKNSSGQIFVGKVWNPVSTVFPDFSHPKAIEYWTKQFKIFHDQVPFDGAWTDMNEPSNFWNGQQNGCENSSLENPPYVPGGIEPLRSKTICMSAKHYNTTHYNEHNLYAYREAIATYYALKNVTSERPFIISRASFPGQGRWSGHWSGDIGSTWEDMRYSIAVLLKFNLYGMTMMGSDICGFRLNTTVELCARWSALGSFYPFSRNHNDAGQKDQDPVALGDVVVAAARNTLTTRYNLLPYLYSLFYRSHVYGDTVARPLFFEFPNDEATFAIEEQFLWGSALMIMPAVYPGVTTINAYFPNDVWYNFYTGEKMNVSGEIVTLDAPIDSINLAFRGGYVIPQQHSNVTTTESRKNKFFLLAGLSNNGTASGELYWDDGVTVGSYEKDIYNLVKFNIEKGLFTSVVAKNNYPFEMNLDFIRVCGLTSAPKEVLLNYNVMTFEFDKYNCLQTVVDVSLLQDFVLQWI